VILYPNQKKRNRTFEKGDLEEVGGEGEGDLQIIPHYAYWGNLWGGNDTHGERGEIRGFVYGREEKMICDLYTRAERAFALLKRGGRKRAFFRGKKNRSACF